MLQRLLLLIGLLIGVGLTGCRRAELYEATFDDLGSWAAGDAFDVSGRLNDGVYELEVKADIGRYWTTADESFADGVYQVETTQTAGPVDAGYGMIFRADTTTDSFYLFEISSDGYYWIGICRNGCSEETVLVGNNPNGWIRSDAVNQGLGVANTLTVRAEGGNLIFSVNGVELGRKSDPTFTRGDIGLLVETIGAGGVVVAFDNFSVAPLE